MTHRAIIFTGIVLILSGGLSSQAIAAEDLSFSGHVFTADNKPADGAFVSLLAHDSPDSYKIIASARANSTGEFKLTSPTLVPGSAASIMADLPGVGFSRLVQTAVGLNLRVVLSKSSELNATFLNPNGNPAAGRAVFPAKILYAPNFDGSVPFLSLPTDIAKRWQVTTDPNGIAVFRGLPTGTSVVLDQDDAHFARLATADAPRLAAQGITRQTIHLQPAANLWISARTADDKPAPGVHIAVISPQFTGAVVADDYGRVELTRLGASSCRLAVEDRDKPPGAESPPVWVLVRAGVRNDAKLVIENKIATPTNPPNVAIVQAIPNVIVANAPNNQAIANMIVVNAAIQPPPLAIVGQMVVNGSSVAQFGIPIEGRVLDPQGKPVPNATVLYPQPGVPPSVALANNTYQSMQSDSDGRFKLNALPGALLRARSGDLATEAPVPAGAPDTSVTLRLSASAIFTVVLKIIDTNGAPITVQPTVTANAIMDHNSNVPPGRFLSPGVLELHGFTTDSPWRLLVGAPDYGSLQVPVPTPTADSPGRVELTVMLPKADQPVSGVVVDQNGNPAPNIGVRLAGVQMTQAAVLTDAQGRFAFQIAKGARAQVMLILPAPDQAYAIVVGASTNLKFYLPPYMTAATYADSPDPTVAQMIDILSRSRPAQPLRPPVATQPAGN